MNRPPSDPGIPVLTEVLAGTPVAMPAEAPAATPAPVMPGFSPDRPWPAEPDAEAAASFAATRKPWPADAAAIAIPATPDTPEQWRQHAQDIEEHVMQQLLGQVNSLLRQQIAEQIAIAFEQVSGQLTARIQQNLELALRRSVQLAVAQEIEKSKLLKNKGL